MKKMKGYIKNYLKEVNENGFSLLELVVAVGILLVLTVGGLLAYNGITKNARVAAVQSAADEVYTGAVAYDSNGDDYKQAETEWNGSSKKGKDGEASITVSTVKNSIGAICASAEMTAHGITVNRGAGCEVEGEVDSGDGGATETPATPEPTVPPVPVENHFINTSTIWGSGRLNSNVEFDSFGRPIGSTGRTTVPSGDVEYSFDGTVYLNRSQFQQSVDFKQDSYTITVQSTNGRPMVLDVANSNLGNYKYQGTVGVAAVKHTFVVNNPSEVERYKLIFKFPNVKVGSTVARTIKPTLTYNIEGNTCFKSGCSLTFG